ncbi:hypothetical protein GCL60_06460 [Silvanigrella paludirubra]|uniref:Uncharacterized protein n=1 Tax=Silvanigrella paludirubra TaxID=2499159 RepID=A0A6N6VVW4_9BACT|nr:hypothetical protein [Silvanigrella paludirubra]KAB8039899.1 hypothetical protein GCL60_06460 [Silvanigrella paludirubra]
MTVYKCTENIGFIYNLHALKNKGWKYVFRQNAITDAKWWLGDHNSDRAQNGAYFIKIDQLRSNLLKNAKIKAKADLFNELLLGLSKNALLGLFIRQDENYSSLDERSIFNIIIGYLSIRYQLKLNLPIFHFDNPKTSINKNNNENRIKVLTLEFFIDFLLNQRNLNNQKKQKNQSSKISASDLSQIYSYIWGINITENSKKYKEIESLSMDEFKRKLNKKLEGAFVLEKDKLKIEKFYIDTLNKMFQFYSNQSCDVLINKTSPDNASINASISSSSYSLSSNLPASGSSLKLPPPPPSLLRSKSKIVPITSPNDASQIIFDTNTEVTHSNLPKFLYNEELKKVLS